MGWGPPPLERQPVVDGDIARVPLTRGQFAIIDAADVHLIAFARWNARQTGGWYATCTRGRRTLLMHRVIAGVPDGVVVDHANHDGLDNRRSNLRIATTTENNRNQRTVHGLNISGFAGVGWNGQTQQWRARVSVNGQRHHIGLYATAEAAALARDDYIRAHFPSQFWTFNFPMPGERGITQPERTSA